MVAVMLQIISVHCVNCSNFIICPTGTGHACNFPTHPMQIDAGWQNMLVNRSELRLSALRPGKIGCSTGGRLPVQAQIMKREEAKSFLTHA
jgi:hypothetical protein